MTDRDSELSDEALGRRLAGELPRYAASPRLRAAIMAAIPARPRRTPWLAPALTALATAAVLVLFFVPMLPRGAPTEPARRLAQAVVSEHSRALMWGARRQDVIPAASSWLTQESGIALARVFAGDDALSLIAAEPVYLERQRGVALHYRDGDGRFITYVALPAPKLRLSDRDRVQIDRFRPMLVHDAGFASWVWKHGDLACFLVSDMVGKSDLDRFKDYFVRVRAATEPLLAY